MKHITQGVGGMSDSSENIFPGLIASLTPGPGVFFSAVPEKTFMRNCAVVFAA
jgi:hypothetical protein